MKEEYSTIILRCDTPKGHYFYISREMIINALIEDDKNED